MDLGDFYAVAVKNSVFVPKKFGDFGYFSESDAQFCGLSTKERLMLFNDGSSRTLGSW
ncbi:MAG TPA: hypothetical protein V6D03_14890 [Candidatus Caenarcaniphilales bacterium]